MTRTAPGRPPPGDEPEDELERLRALLNDLPGMVYLEDADPRIEGPGPLPLRQPRRRTRPGLHGRGVAGRSRRVGRAPAPRRRAGDAGRVPGRRSDRRAVQRRLPDVRQGRADRVDPRRGRAGPRRGRRSPVLAGRDVRDDRPPGHARTAPGGRAALPSARRADAGRDVHRPAPPRPHERVLQPAGRGPDRLHPGRADHRHPAVARAGAPRRSRTHPRGVDARRARRTAPTTSSTG